MSIQPIQVILIIFIFWAISRVYLRAKDKSLTSGEGMFWFSIFALAAVGVIDPNFTTYLARQLGIGRGSDVVIYLSIVLLFYLIFRINVYLENIRHDITKLVREISLLRFNQEPKKSTKKSKS